MYDDLGLVVLNPTAIDIVGVICLVAVVFKFFHYIYKLDRLIGYHDPNKVDSVPVTPVVKDNIERAIEL